MGKTTFIKLDRSIAVWRWYKNANTCRVFIHCLLSANIKDGAFENVTVPRGSFITSYGKLSEALGLSADEVRTAIKHLKTTGELTVKRGRRFQLITVTGYELYQSKPTEEPTPSDPLLPFSSQQLKKDKKEKKERDPHAYTRAKSFDADEFFLAALEKSMAEAKKGGSDGEK